MNRRGWEVDDEEEEEDDAYRWAGKLGGRNEVWVREEGRRRAMIRA